MTTSKKQSWGLLIIPVEFMISKLLFPLVHLDKHPKTALIASTVLFLAGFLLMLDLFHDFLQEQWRLYRHQLFFKLLLAIFLVGGAFLILWLVRRLIPSQLLLSTSSTSGSSQSLSPGWMVLAAVAPFIAPFTEELYFRYLLLGKFSTKILRAIMLFVQAILFGFVYGNNFNSNVYTMIPYMVLGVYLGVIYLLSKNIWSSIMVHWMLNIMNAVLPALLLWIFSFLGITT